MRFVHDRLDLFEGERGACDERAVWTELTQLVADKILRRVDFGPIRSMQLQLAHAGARQPGAIDVLAVGQSAVEPGSGVRRRVRRAWIERLARHLHSRT